MDAIEVRVQTLEEEIRTIKKDSSEAHEKIYDRLRDLEKETAVAAERYKNILDELSGQKSQLASIMASIDELSRKPVKRYDSAVTGFISALAGLIAGLIGKSIFGG